jgi:hypothetical protein
MDLFRCLALLAALSLAGCVSGGPASAVAPPSAEHALEANHAAMHIDNIADCEAAGGNLQRLGRGPRLYCVTPFADAGKVCSSKADCSGACMAQTELEAGASATGRCQRDASEGFGCRQRISAGLVDAMICID